VANSFTNILPILTDAAQVVSREACGMLRAVTLHTDDAPVSLGSVLNLPKAPTASAGNWEPSLAPTLADTTATGVQLSLSTARKVDFHVTAEQAAQMDRSVGNALHWFGLQTAQGMRTLANELELALWTLAYKNSSRAVGTALTTPFASTLAAASQVAAILDANGAPRGTRSLVMDPAAYGNFRGLFANVATTRPDASFAAGELPEVSGLMPQMSPAISLHTDGTASGATVNNAGYAAGATTLTLSSAGTGTILAGDVVSLATENAGHNFVVTSGDADVSNGGTMVIGAPGLRAAIATATRAITLAGNYTPNLALSSDAIYCAVRAPLQVDGGIGSQEIVVDPVSGIPFGVYRHVGDGVVHYSIRMIYGLAVVEQGHIATLMG
jgi:hypothetical protein